MYIDKVNKKVTLGGSGASIIGFSNGIMTKYKFDSYNIGGKLPAIYVDQTQHLEMDNNQIFYLFTDGITDMKGGDAKKKYMIKNLETLLYSIQENSFDKQKQKIEQLILDWNNNVERIDDITFLAVKL
jgi:serine phosphatase RsbU (regulator of sigma subunit)